MMKYIEKNMKKETENGAVGYMSTGSKLLDLNFSIPSFREGIDKNLFDMALEENTNLTLKWLLYLRDIREGVGERKSFREFVQYLLKHDREIGEKFIECVPIEEYGRWDDYLCFLDTDAAKEKIAGQFKKDMCSDTPSLLGKWLPSENTSSAETRKMARKVRSVLGLSPREYRKSLSELRKKIDIVERKMSSGEWESIEYDKVPSRANLIYSKSFIKHDFSRRNSYLCSLENGETKINANAMFLHDIVSMYGEEYDKTLELLWENQKKVEGFSNTLVVRDGSGSMQCHVGGVLAQDIADAITLYCAENNTGEFKDKFITFSYTPELVDIRGKKSLKDKLDYLREFDDCSNTDIYNVFNMILETATKYGISQEEMPNRVLIVSDMEFDCVNTCDTPLFEFIEEEFNAKGYSLPKLVFWNVNSRTNTIPVCKDGVTLLSGFSKNLMSMVMSSEIDPYKALVNILESGRYNVIDEIVM